MLNESGRFAAYVLRNLHEFYKGTGIKNEDIDIIHWNAGLWDSLRLFGEDVHTPIDIYAYYIERICQRIKNLYSDAKVIFATSISVISERMSPNFKRYNEEIEEYNKRAVEIVTKYGFYVNDLYTLSKSLPEEAHSDAVHYYTPMETKAFTLQVLEHLKPLLNICEELEYKEEMYTAKPHGI